MCGIAGIFYRDGRTVDRRLLSAMTDSVRHRGPDDSGLWSDGAIGLGHRRLAIRDLTAAGRQPLADASGRVVISYNGEIYNDGELRAELSRDFGVRFRSSCDSEIIPAGYLAWGDKLFERLEGMFALALWDREAGRLLLVRDGVGIKPLFYSDSRDVVRFGSEIKVLLADPEQERRLTAHGVHRLLALGHSGPGSTTLDGIRQVPPGTILSFTRAEQSSRRYWMPRRRPDIVSLDHAVEEFSAIWARVVRDQLISDVPVGVLQSGGIDSTLVSLAANAPGAPRTPLFTATFPDQTFDESPLARMVAEQLGTAFHQVPVQSQASLAEILRQVVHHYDGQVCDEASIALYLLSKAVRNHVTVALCGDGGDEFFAGYPTYRISALAAALGGALPRAAWASVGRALYRRGARKESRLPLVALAARFALGVADGGRAHAHAYWRRLVPRFLLDDLYGPALRPLIGTDPFDEYRQALDGGDGTVIDRCLVADQRFHLPGGLLLKTDAMTMAHGLEVRVPFLDRRVMEFAGRCDRRLLMRSTGENKRVLRRAAERLGAPRALTTARKRGFNAPLARLLRHGLRPAAEACFERDVQALEPFLEPGGVRRIWREHREGEVNHAYALWPILNLALWLPHQMMPAVPTAAVPAVAVASAS